MLRLSIWTVADKFKFIDGCSRSNTYDMDNQARSSHANHGHKISISNRTTPGAIGERTRNHRGAGFRRDDSGSSPTRIQAMLRVEKPNQG